MGSSSVSIPSLDDLMGAASRDAGLSDFGSASFRSGFERFLQSLAEDAQLPAEALGPTLATLQRRLTNRLHVERWYAEHPEISRVPVTGPVAITGIPRSGTTALADMMSLDPQFRPLRGWEQRQPCPPPVAGEEHDDPRRLEAIRNHELMRVERPEQLAMHLWDVDATTEDTDVLGMEGRAQSAVVPVTGYHRWWREQPMVEAYHYHHRIAQLLHSRRPPTTWLFKSPHMSFHLEDFVAAYPGARFVLTHRDPAKAVPSWVSFVSSLFPPGTMKTIDTKAYGRHLAEHLAVGTERSIESRRRLGDERFYDLHQHDFAADPMGTVERIYEWLGRELTPEVRAAMEAWSHENRSGAHGAHQYAPEDFGLDEAELRDRFRPYIERFGVRAAG